MTNRLFIGLRLTGLRVIVVSLLFVNLNQISYAQKKIEYIANIVDFDKSIGINAQRLIGDVRFKHDNTLMYCDSAYFYSEENRLDAFSRVHIIQPDGVNMYGDLLKYNGNTKLALVRKNVKIIDKQSTLFTDFFDFDNNLNIGHYFNGGKILNDSSILTSFQGYYYSKEKKTKFMDSVKFVNPKYTIYSDSMLYFSETKVVQFICPTDIVSKDNYLYTEGGWYNTITEMAEFNKNSYLENDHQKLKGDILYYDKKKGIGHVYNHVEAIDTTQRIIITGNKAEYIEKPEYLMVTDSAVLINYNEKDSLFLHADTLLSNHYGEKDRIIRAFYKVKIFKPDLQGKCDSLTYSSIDSTVRMYYDPVIWSDENQLTADSIHLFTTNRHLDRMKLYNTPFIISREDSSKYNQIKGKNMTGYFDRNQLYKIDVFGNGQTVYYPKDKNDIIGVNKAASSNLVIFIENKKVKKIKFYPKPDATLYPLEKAPKDELILKGFIWLDYYRPKSKDDIFLWGE